MNRGNDVNGQERQLKGLGFSHYSMGAYPRISRVANGRVSPVGYYEKVLQTLPLCLAPAGIDRKPGTPAPAAGAWILNTINIVFSAWAWATYQIGQARAAKYQRQGKGRAEHSKGRAWAWACAAGHRLPGSGQRDRKGEDIKNHGRYSELYS